MVDEAEKKKKEIYLQKNKFMFKLCPKIPSRVGGKNFYTT